MVSAGAVGEAAAQCGRRPLDEYLAVMRKMGLDDAYELIGHGVPIRAIAAVCPAPTRVLLDGNDRRFRPDPAGQPAWVMPVCVIDPERLDAIEASDPSSVVSIGPAVDLLAFHPCAPNRWALRYGIATVLGTIAPQYCNPDPVPVHRDVTSWLRAECAGIMLLTHDPNEARRVLQQIHIIQAEDEQHEAQLRHLIEMPAWAAARFAVRSHQKIAA
jgi:hypothetical protein